MKVRSVPSMWGGCGSPGVRWKPVFLDPLPPCLPQGVEFFDEKLNSLCMAWLVDHGEYPSVWQETGALGRMHGRAAWGWWEEWGSLELSSQMLAWTSSLACQGPGEVQGSRLPQRDRKSVVVGNTGSTGVALGGRP